MYEDGKIWIGTTKNDRQEHISLVPKMANRHGLIAGATGTGKTITLKVLAESFSDCGVPVFLADVKGDLASMCRPGTDSEDMQKRIEKFHLEELFAYKAYPTCLWDIFGEAGHPLRATVSDMGPILLASLLDLNDTQSSILSIVFHIADEQNLLLIDLKDLRLMLEYVGDHAQEYTLKYGNITKQSIGAITRSVVALQTQGGDQFFGEPALDIRDWMRTDISGRGFINVLHCETLIHTPKLYATFLLWLCSELFENLPEAGDPEKPRMVFFFDEAHLLFDNSSKALMQKIEQLVKLIRSKGVGIYFVTQSPSDVPDAVLEQLGNRVQHALRAYTPADQKKIRATALSFRGNPEFSTEEVLTQLGIGEALISTLDEEGVPIMVQQCKVLPPQSRMGTIDAQERQACLLEDGLGAKYDAVVDRESAYEILAKQYEEAAEKERAEKEALQQEKEEKLRLKEEEKAQKEAEKLRKEKEREEKKREQERRKKYAPLERAANSAMSTIGREVTKSLLRGVMGTLKK